jgi:hypothetical protein
MHPGGSLFRERQLLTGLNVNAFHFDARFFFQRLD